MSIKTVEHLKDGDQCKAVAGNHKGKTGTVKDINLSKTGHIILLLCKQMGQNLKHLAKMWW
jgi:ribosomal protein L24